MPAWLLALRPVRTAVNGRERLRVALGAALGIAVVVLVCHRLGDGGTAWPWIVAPMGASAVLVFAVPSSPFAHPWSVVAGNTVSALVGVACVRWLGPPVWAAAPAVGVAIALMFGLRCLHPPGGATALMVTLLGVSDPRFAVFPVAVNAVLLVAAGLAWNNLTRRPYPSRPATRTWRVMIWPTRRPDVSVAAGPCSRVKSAGVTMPTSPPCASTTGRALMRWARNSGQASSTGVAWPMVISWRDMMSPQRMSARRRW